MTVPFWKVESVGNDFVLVRQADADAVGLREEQLPDFARRTSPRRFAVGSDGLLVLETRFLPLRMRMFNPDGSEDFCGNGLRCAARFALLQGAASGSFSIDHGGRTVPVEVDPDGTIRTRLGAASFASADVPLAPGVGELFETPLQVGQETVTLSALTTGSTHAVVFVDALPEDERFERLGRGLETHSAFPERTSVIWATVEDAWTLRIRIWERGAGETLGCGTGSSAAAIAHLRRLGAGGTVAVHNPGGTLRVSAEAWNAPITVEGTAEVLFQGRFEF